MIDSLGMGIAIVLTACIVTLCTGCPFGRTAVDVQRACAAPLAALDVEYGLALTEACRDSDEACDATKRTFEERYAAVAEECAK